MKRALTACAALVAGLLLTACTASGTPPAGTQSPPGSAAPSGAPSADVSSDPRAGTYPYPNCPEDVNGCEWDPNGYPHDGLMWEMDEAFEATLLPAETTVFRPQDIGPYPVGDALAVDMWEVGYGWALVEEGAFCLWLGTWLTVRGTDSEQESLALGEMEHFLTTRTFRDGYDSQSSQPYIRDLVERAVLGDPNVAQTHWEVNCYYYHDQIKAG